MPTVWARFCFVVLKVWCKTIYMSPLISLRSFWDLVCSTSTKPLYQVVENMFLAALFLVPKKVEFQHIVGRCVHYPCFNQCYQNRDILWVYSGLTSWIVSKITFWWNRGKIIDNRSGLWTRDRKRNGGGRKKDAANASVWWKKKKKRKKEGCCTMKMEKNKKAVHLLFGVNKQCLAERESKQKRN